MIHSLEELRVAVIGLGYVGLPLAVEFGKKRAVVGFDINTKRIAELQADSHLRFSAQLHHKLLAPYPHLEEIKPVYRNLRSGDVHHYLAEISKAATQLGYASTQRITHWLALAMPWHVRLKLSASQYKDR